MRPVPAVPFDDPMNYNHQVIKVNSSNISMQVFAMTGRILAHSSDKSLKGGGKGEGVLTKGFGGGVWSEL